MNPNALTVNEHTANEVEQRLPRPRWEGSPTFAGVWRGNAMLTNQAVCQSSGIPKHMGEGAAETIVALNTAQCIVIDREQVEILRDCVMVSAEQGRECLEMVSLWSPCIYLDLGGCAFDNGEGESLLLAGALIWQQECEYPGFAFFGWDPEYRRGTPLFTQEQLETGEQASLGPEAYTLLTLTALQWMECENVEVVDQEWPSRQVRRQAERDGTKISKIVQVREPKYRRRTPPSGNTRNFSHRFSVRGRYNYLPKTTKIGEASPEKLSWVPERGDYFRRIWQPEHIKGDPSKPFMPKTKVVKK